MYVIALSEQVEKRCPGVLAFPTCQESFGVTHKHNSFACTRQQNVETLWSCQKADVAFTVTATQTGYDDVAFFSLIIVYKMLAKTRSGPSDPRATYQW